MPLTLCPGQGDTPFYVSVKSGISILIAFPGERLDYCSCESLEEILKSVQFDFISLQGAELEENVSI